jgi:hypothetical protein
VSLAACSATALASVSGDQHLSTAANGCQRRPRGCW